MSKLWYQQPAFEWEEALPLGNGRLGAMVFGKVAKERLQVNEESMWYGGKADRNNPDARKKLPEIRELIFKGEIKKAEKLMKFALSGCPKSMHPYQTLGDIYLEFEDVDDYTDYYRELDLEKAVYRQSFVSHGTLYRREMFISKPAGIMVMHFTAEGDEKISFAASLERERFFDGIKKAGTRGICLYGNLGKGGFDFSMMLTADSKDGRIEVIGEHLLVSNASDVTLYFGADTSYHVPSAMLEPSINDKIQKAAGSVLEVLMEEHVEDYNSLYGRVEFDLGDLSGYDKIPTDQRIEAAKDKPADTGLSKLYFDFGRYLLISCSREGGLPATLQGLWNKDMLPPWDSKYTININTEMNYWPAESCNLSECHMPLFDLIKKMVPNGQKTAKQMYGCGGFMCHHNTDIHGDTATQDHWIPGSYWVMGAAWLCTHQWMHYQYTLDQEFLKESFPIMREAAQFFLDFLVEHDGYLVTCPSVSPENTFILPNGEKGANIYGVTMDNQILRDLFSQCIEAAKILGVEDEMNERIKAAREKLIPTRIGKHGAIMEWPEDYEELEPGHRHISHLYGLHPSCQITVDGTPELAKAARVTLERRLSAGGGHTGWSRAWITNHYARLWDGEKAYESIEKLFASSTYPNLFDKHPPFQIDGNFGITAAIAEMLVQSSTEKIHLLPALPAAWGTGFVKGLCVKNAGEVDIYWKNGVLNKCTVRSRKGMVMDLKYGETSVSFKWNPGQEISFVWNKESRTLEKQDSI
mgnify:CR=1 FL=1